MLDFIRTEGGGLAMATQADIQHWGVGSIHFDSCTEYISDDGQQIGQIDLFRLKPDPGCQALISQGPS